MINQIGKKHNKMNKIICYRCKGEGKLNNYKTHLRGDPYRGFKSHCTVDSSQCGLCEGTRYIEYAIGKDLSVMKLLKRCHFSRRNSPDKYDLINLNTFETILYQVDESVINEYLTNLSEKDIKYILNLRFLTIPYE